MLSKVEADAVMDQLDVDSKAKSFLIHESKSLFSILFPSPLSNFQNLTSKMLDKFSDFNLASKKSLLF